MRPNVSKFVRSCDPCQKTNPAELSTPYGKISFGVLFHTWSFDFSCPLKETDVGNKYLLLAVELLSCRPVACAIGAEMFNSTEVISFLEEQICWLHGNPVRIVSDGDSKFDNSAVRDFASSAGIQWKID